MKNAVYVIVILIVLLSNCTRKGNIESNVEADIEQEINVSDTTDLQTKNIIIQTALLPIFQSSFFIV